MSLVSLAVVAMLAGIISPDWSLAKAHAEKRGMRERISLNGYWRFIPCEESVRQVPADDAGWGWMVVPGAWRECGYGNFMHDDADKPVRKFGGKEVSRYPACFYRRTFDPPLAMKDMEVRLYFDLFFFDMQMWINGREVEIPRSQVRRFHVPIGKYLNFGQKNEIAIRASDGGIKRYSNRCGIRSDLWLEARPRLNFGEPAVNTSLSDRCIRLEFIGSGVKSGSGKLRRRIVDCADGKEVYSDSVAFAEKSEIPFVTPKLWSPESPALYRLELQLDDADGKTLDSASVRFGFRELKIVGGDYLLNGKRVEMFCDSSWPSRWTHQWHIADDYARKCLRTLKAMNVTSLYGHPAVLPESFFNLADEEGFMILYAVMDNGLDIHRTPFAEYLPVFESAAKAQSESRAFINHPCNVGILNDIWYNYHDGTRNAAFIGMREESGNDPNLKRAQPAARAADLHKLVEATNRIFPRYEVFTGADGHCGNLYSTHIYHTWGVPTAELSAMFSRYSKERGLPIFAGEVNVQYPGAFGDIRKCPSPGLYTENAARLFGPEAYSLERVNTEFFCAGPDNDFLKSTDCYDPLDRRSYYFVSDIYARTLTDYIERLIMPWRYDWANGFGFFEHVITAHYLLSARNFSNINEIRGDLTRPGTKSEQLWGTHHRPPFEHLGSELLLRPGIAAVPFLRATDPLTVGFAGPGSDRYETDHAWFGGERLAKALAVVNRTETAHEFEAKIKLVSADGALLGEWSDRVSVGVWTNSLVRFEIALPRVSSRTEAMLKADLKATDGGENLSCSMDVELFPRLDREANGEIALALHGASAELVRRVKALGFKVEDSATSLPVFAPGSMLDPALRERARSLSQTGSLLVMEQPLEASHELVKVRQRKAFIYAHSHPALAEFKDVDFSYWRGSEASVCNFGVAKAGVQWTDWGSRNMVVANVFRRPTHGNLISLLVCGFDLFESPLMEYRGEGGTMVLSQLELASRLGEDPVATRLFCNLVGYLHGRKSAKRKVGIVAGKDGAAYLKKLGVQGEAVALDKLTDFSAYDVLVISSPDWQALRRKAMEIADFAYGGGKVVYLHAKGDFSSTWLPFALEHGKSQKCDGAKAEGAADATWLNGWGGSELYWHDQLEVPVFTKAPKSAAATSPQFVVRRKLGSGEFMLVSASPDDFPSGVARGKWSRLISAVLTSTRVSLGCARDFPFEENRYFQKVLTEGSWQFAEDHDDRGRDEKWQEGGGKPKWITGQTTMGGDYVKAGTPWKRFLEKPYKGIGWYRITFELSEREAAEPDAQLIARNVHSVDRMWINARHVGAYGKSGADRVYHVPKGLLKPGQNTLVVRLSDDTGDGGLWGSVDLVIGSGTLRHWSAPWPEGASRDYNYPCDLIRMY